MKFLVKFGRYHEDEREKKYCLLELNVKSLMSHINDVGWSCSSAIGESRGIVALWRNESIEPIFSFKGENFMGVKINWNNLYYVVNIYSACSISLKRILWREILELKKKLVDGEWVFEEILIL